MITRQKLEQAGIDDVSLKRSIYFSMLALVILPPAIGVLEMGMLGFYPFPEILYIFKSYSGAYVLIVLCVALIATPRFVRLIQSLPEMEHDHAGTIAHSKLAKSALTLLAATQIYTSLGAFSTDISLNALGFTRYTLNDSLYHQFGIIPIVLVVTFPIFFLLLNRMGRYLAPRGICVSVVPLWVKIAMLGIISPLMIDTLLIGYFYNRTGFFEIETLVVWFMLFALATGGAILVWKNFQQGLSPLDGFIRGGDIDFTERARRELVPISLDELGVLTSRFAVLLGAQKNLSDDLNRTQALSSVILDSTPVMMAYLDTNFNFIRVNGAYADADGKKAEFFVGKNHFELYPHPENEKIFRDVLATGAPYAVRAKPFEYAMNPERGVSHWDWTLIPVKDSRGIVIGLVLSVMEVTERIRMLEENQRQRAALLELNKTLESRINERTRDLLDAHNLNQQMLAAANVGMAALDSVGQCVFVNDRLTAILGKPREILLKQNCRELFTGKESGLQHLANQALNGEAVNAKEVLWGRGLNGPVWLSVFFARFERKGEPHLLAMIEDITERKLAEEELIAAKVQAERANATKSEFLSRMSHELRTPMNAILGFSQVLEQEQMTNDQRSFVKEIHMAGDHLLKLIDELLDMAKIEAGKMGVVVDLVAVSPVIEHSIKLVLPLAESAGIRINNQAKTDALVAADGTRLRQILVNLLSNAVKYNRPNGEVVVNCEQIDDARQRISVIDNGQGIAPEKFEKLFQPFERLEAQYTGIDGTGIGLALVRQIAELMGAEIGFTSELGVGSTFWVDLPLVRENNTRSIKGVESPALPNILENRYRVMYVEDNPANLRVVEALFRSQPRFQLVTAVDGGEGLRLALEHPPDVILLDINLPGMDGYAVLRALRDHPATRSIPVIALSADAMQSDVDRGLSAGFDRYMTKPLNIKQLMEILSSTLAGRKSH